MLPDKDELLCIFTDLTLKHDTALSGGFRRGSGRHPPSPLVLHDNSSTGWFDWSMPAWLRLLVTKHSLRFRAERFWFTLFSLKYQCFVYHRVSRLLPENAFPSIVNAGRSI